MVTYFNWNELCRDSDQDFTAILILTYCLTKSYNTIIAKGSNQLLKTLGITYMPAVVSMRGFIYANKFKNIRNNYQCREPASYFNNPMFITNKNVSLTDKIYYLKLLSYRPIDDKNNFIPKDMIANERLLSCKLIQQDNEKIYFAYDY